MRVMLHLILLITVSLAAVIEFPAVMAGGNEDSTLLLGLAFCTTAVFGALTLVTLFGRQPTHFMIRKIFCGMGAAIILFIIFSQLIIGEWSRWTGDSRMQCILMLSMLVSGAVGLLAERGWRQQAW
jgi:hypothetical protein